MSQPHSHFESMKHPRHQATLPRRVHTKWSVIKKISMWSGLFLLIAFCIAASAYWFLSRGPTITAVQYGMSFDPVYAQELGLDWRKTFDAIVEPIQTGGLGVHKLRIGVRWPLIEPADGQYQFNEIDYILRQAEEKNLDIILVVGRRNLRWPECHVPSWATNLSKDATRTAVLDMVETVINRYKNNSAISMWQIENEPFLEVFSPDACGQLDEELLQDEIALAHEIDPSRKVLVTDSGNLGTWYMPWKLGDAFGTSVYQYLWNPEVGPFKSLVPASFYRAKRNLMELLLGEKPSYLIELSIEPWLVAPIINTPIETQFERMSIDKFEEILDFAHDIGFEQQYLWGAEWWYWLKQKGYPDFWTKGQEIFK